MGTPDPVSEAFEAYMKKEFPWDDSIMSQIPPIDHFTAGWEARGEIEKTPEKGPKPPIYSFATFMERAKILKEYGLIVSFQYGMVFLLDEDGGILLRLDALLSEEDRMAHS